MTAQEIAKVIMELPEDERLELARRIIASVVSEQQNSEQTREAVRDIEDVLAGKARPLNKAESETALH